MDDLNLLILKEKLEIGDKFINESNDPEIKSIIESLNRESDHTHLEAKEVFFADKMLLMEQGELHQNKDVAELKSLSDKALFK